ncbi:hypothetical protein ACIBWG_02055 [Streptomyces griseoaurantiacus]|uniref:hypothetical protein n=1 Tax=Streptomyces griseoaurantiacus TaxID=68213 RepID=UPI00378EFC52
MKITAGNTISLTAAAPGSFVEIEGIPHTGFVVVAWAVVCTYADENGMETAVQPVFVVDGETYTTAEWYRDRGVEAGVKVVAQ